MKSLTKSLGLLFAGLVFTGATLTAQEGTKTESNSTQNTKQMKTYLIEREIPDAAKLTGDQLKGISQKSCSVLKELGTGIQWIHSYVAGDKIYCIYKAENEEIIRQHAQKGGFPANRITEVATVISPATATN